MMSVNMNLTIPMADWFMGTSDLERSLLGTIFNGYNEDHVRADLKPAIERFRSHEASATFDGPRGNWQ
jgi:hypothetical protein